MKKKDNKIPKNPAFLFDYSTLRKMLEGDKKALKILDEIDKVNKEANVVGVKVISAATVPCFLHALYTLSEDKIDTENIKKIMDVLTLMPLFKFKNEYAVKTDMIEFASSLSKSGPKPGVTN